MLYFSWVLGLGLACAFAILNAMWLELHQDSIARTPAGEPTDTTVPPPF
jgi:cyd operon protein YbgT